MEHDYERPTGRGVERSDLDRQHLVIQQLREVTDRLDEAEQRITRLENALRGLARHECDVGISHPCNRCERSLLIVKNGTMICPECNYSRSM